MAEKISDYTESKTYQLVKSRYKDRYGRPFCLTPGQLEVFDIISKRKYPRVHCMAYTRWGKSETVGLGILTRITAFPEKWVVVAPSNKKAGIIMGVIIQHIFDNPYTLGKFKIGKDENLDRIRRERSKDRLTFKISDNRIGEVFIISSEGKRTKDLLDALMGFGAPNVVVDESSLIDDIQYAGIKRMLGDEIDNFLFEIGNPFRRNHFLRASQDPLYHQINVDYIQGIQEGRITRDYVEEMRKEAEFSVLYENKFPEEDAIDTEGWMPLITEAELKNACVPEIDHLYVNKLGIDLKGSGKDYNCLIHRSWLGAEVVLYDQSKDSMGFMGRVLTERDRVKLETGEACEVFPDTVGSWHWYQTLSEKIPFVYPVVGGEKPDDIKFFNSRAEMYWRMRDWMLKGGKLKGKYEDWKELLVIKWRRNQDKQIQLMPKMAMLKKGIKSPNKGDALAYTFKNEDDFGADEAFIEKQDNRSGYGKQFI